MENYHVFIFVFLLVFIISLVGIVYAVDNDEQIMTVSANIFAGDVPSNDTVTNESLVRIWVPDHISLGDTVIGQLSNVNGTKIVINNTGNVHVLIRAELTNPNDEIFKFIQFTNSSSKSHYNYLENFSTDISGRTRTIYARLDLRDYVGDFEDDQIGREAQIRFIAMAA